MNKRTPIAGFLFLALFGMAGGSIADDFLISRGDDTAVAFSAAESGQNATLHQERRRGWRGTRGCASANAMGQAAREGMLRPSIADFNRRRVVLEGTGRFGWGRMVFANTPGCPLIIR